MTISDMELTRMLRRIVDAAKANLEMAEELRKAVLDLEKRLLTLQQYIHYQGTNPLDSFTKHG